MFIDSQTLVDDGALLDFGLVEARRLFPCPSRRPLATVVVGNPRNHFVFLDLLEVYLQIQDNYFIPVCLLVFTCVASCNLILA
jgi:hypothetical protein